MGDLELQYNNRARVPEHPAIVDEYRRASEAFRTQCMAAGRAELGLTYGASARQFVDIFTPEGCDAQTHLSVFIHGGYWQIFDPQMFSHMAQGAMAHGVPMALIGYDLAPAVSLSDIVEQIRNACVFLHRHTKRRLVLSGHSAGGHLTAAMAATDWAARGAPGLFAGGLAISGVFELRPLLQTTMNVALQMDEASADALSPIHWDPRGTIVDAWVGGAESEEFIRQSRDFAAAWAAKGARTCTEIVPDANHFTIINALVAPDSPMTRRLVELARG